MIKFRRALPEGAHMVDEEHAMVKATEGTMVAIHYAPPA